MDLTRDHLISLVQRILSPSGLSNAERTTLIARLQEVAREPRIQDFLVRLAAPLTAEQIADLALACRTRRSRMPSLN